MGRASVTELVAPDNHIGEPMPTCPCCGQATETLDRQALTYLDLSPRQRDVVEDLVRCYPRTSTLAAIRDRVYANDPNGGPLHANTISVLIWRMRPTLNAAGWDIRSKGQRPGGIRLWAPHELERLNA